MPDADRSDVYEQLAGRGISRRGFLAFCGVMATMIGLSETMAPTIASAIEQAVAAPLAPAVWLNGGSCTGCTESMAQGTTPDIAQVVLDILSLNYIETLMMAQGDSADLALTETAQQNSGRFIAIYEGSVMEGFGGNALRIAGKSGIDQIKEILPRAAAVIAVGSCAVDGGWVKASPNPAGATGVGQWMAANGVKVPVINLPTCPVNPEWVVAMIVDVLLLGELKSGAILGKLDRFGRPKLIFGQSVHDNCPRRGHFENGEFVYRFGTDEEAKGYCLYPLGCKGPLTFTNCPLARWNDRTSWCVEAGSPCIGCGGSNWVDQNSPFLNRFRRIAIESANGGYAPTTLGAIAGGVAAGALLAHGIATVATGRSGGDAPIEEMKEHDRRALAKERNRQEDAIEHDSDETPEEGDS